VVHSRPIARGWLALCLLGALVTTVLLHRLMPVVKADWLALALLTLGAAIAHRYPVHSIGLTTFRLTNVFLLVRRSSDTVDIRKRAIPALIASNHSTYALSYLHRTSGIAH